MQINSVIAQDVALRPVKKWLENPTPKCWCFLGEPGIGKTMSARMIAADLGCDDDLHGLHEVTASELSIDKCRQLFDRDLRLRNMFGTSQWKVLLIEELELLSPAAQVFLKTNLEQLPKQVVVIATSNDIGRLQYALVERFHLRKFDSGEEFGNKMRAFLHAKWVALHNAEPPRGYIFWGFEGKRFSMRKALRELETAEAELVG